MIATLTSKGQLTLPVAIRRKLHLKSGEKLEILSKNDGRIEAIPVKQSIRALKGILPPPKQVVSLNDMKNAMPIFRTI